MTIAKDVVYALHERLKDLSKEATPDQLAYLAKALEAIAGKSTTLDILDVADREKKDIQNKASESEALAVGAIEAAHQSTLDDVDTLKARVMKTIDNAQSANLSLLENKTASAVEKVAALKNHYTDAIEEFEKNKSGFVKDSLPFLFGVLSRNNDTWGIGGLTSQLGKWTQPAYADNILRMLTGCHSETTNYSGFYRPPQMCFFQGQHGNFIFKEKYERYASGTNTYYYPYAAIGVLFVKNPTDQPIKKPLSFGGSSYWSSQYEGLALHMGVPDKTDSEKSDITKLNWQTIYAYTSNNQALNQTAEITIPAQTTVALVLYTSGYYHTNASSRYSQFIHWHLHSVRSQFLMEGLVIDKERTKLAHQCPGFSNTFELWK